MTKYFHNIYTNIPAYDYGGGLKHSQINHLRAIVRLCMVVALAVLKHNTFVSFVSVLMTAITLDTKTEVFYSMSIYLRLYMLRIVCFRSRGNICILSSVLYYMTKPLVKIISNSVVFHYTN